MGPLVLFNVNSSVQIRVIRGSFSLVFSPQKNFSNEPNLGAKRPVKA